MHHRCLFLFFFLSVFLATIVIGQEASEKLLTLDRIYASNEFRPDYQRPIFWIEDGDAFITIEQNTRGQDELVSYQSRNHQRSIFLNATSLTPSGRKASLAVEDFLLSPDGTKVLIFTNSSRVWRSNTKGDYWVYDKNTQALKQIGADFPSSSLMFAKFSDDNQYVAYVQGFNIYREDFSTAQVTQLTEDGDGEIINGTFDWVYEEEFGQRDGFSWSPDGRQIAFWQLDASAIGTFYMIDNTDSVYSQPVPVQYPKVGYDPSSAKVGLLNTTTGEISWIPVPGDPVQHYLPAMQWVNDDLLLIQQLNRKQNELNIYTYVPSQQSIEKIYTETEDTWVDLGYPDVSSNQWGDNDLLLTKDKTAFLRMTENDGWRHMYRVDLTDGKKTLLTPGEYDVAAYYAISDESLFFSASPDNATQRYLYSVPLSGKGALNKLTPDEFAGINTYDIAPNGRYGIHHHTDAESPRTTRLVRLPDHQVVASLVSNARLKEELASLSLPRTNFFQVAIRDGLKIDGRMTKPLNFDSTQQYPVIFHVYGEPWGTVAMDSWVGLYELFLAQQGFVVINMDNRGTPSLKGSDWRKCIYRKIGVLNTEDQALAAQEVLKQFGFIDEERVNVWGHSGGGSMTLNLMFRYPEIYKTGIARAAVANQLFYDNVYQERYMGLPQENREDFVEGSPVTYAKNLKGNLLIIHGTGDDNVHYQNTEYLINELVRHNKQFSLMVYPNRSHGLYEGENTQRHLQQLMTDYFIEKNSIH